MQDQSPEETLRSPEGQAALRTVMHQIWQAGGGDDLRWYGVYDPELERVTAICANRELAELLQSKLGDTPDEIRVLSYDEAQAALAAAQRERAALARFYGQDVPPGDVP